MRVGYCAFWLDAFPLRSAYSPASLVADFMTLDVLTIKEDTPLDKVVAIFRQTSVRRLPVARDDKLVGILSRRDLIRVINEAHALTSTMPWAPVPEE